MRQNAKQMLLLCRESRIVNLPVFKVAAHKLTNCNRGCPESHVGQPSKTPLKGEKSERQKNWRDQLASFRILWAMHTSPHSVLTFSSPRR